MDYFTFFDFDFRLSLVRRRFGSGPLLVTFSTCWIGGIDSSSVISFSSPGEVSTPSLRTRVSSSTGGLRLDFLRLETRFSGFGSQPATIRPLSSFSRFQINVFSLLKSTFGPRTHAEKFVNNVWFWNLVPQFEFQLLEFYVLLEFPRVDLPNQNQHHV